MSLIGLGTENRYLPGPKCNADFGASFRCLSQLNTEVVVPPASSHFHSFLHGKGCLPLGPCMSRARLPVDKLCPRVSGLPCRFGRSSSRDLSPALAGPRRLHFLLGGAPQPALGRLGKAECGRNEVNAENGFTKASAFWGDEGRPKSACLRQPQPRRYAGLRVMEATLSLQLAQATNHPSHRPCLTKLT
ncbi:unnamed protein product [Pleuronectes platessa]|uniref:Uncharacterized protein n=1 Tax=Pleuronectes platessa TaxID=8262 RepID=A0A9N7UL87_PLEPL|nr:unnamed protein product [Pleuronectes platessa]